MSQEEGQRGTAQSICGECDGYFIHIGGGLTESDPYPWVPRSRYERETGMVDPMILRWD